MKSKSKGKRKKPKKDGPPKVLYYPRDGNMRLNPSRTLEAAMKRGYAPFGAARVDVVQVWADGRSRVCGTLELS